MNPTAWRKLISGTVIATVSGILFAANLADGEAPAGLLPLFALGLVYMAWGLRLLGAPPIDVGE